MLVVVADHFHVLADLAEQLPLLLPALAPAAEVAFELRLMLAAIIVIVAVELAQVPLAHGAIVRVVEAAEGVIAGHRAIITAAIAEAAASAPQLASPTAVIVVRPRAGAREHPAVIAPIAV